MFLYQYNVKMIQNVLIEISKYARISLGDAHMCVRERRKKTCVFRRKTDMTKPCEYYVVRERALPEVLLKVVEAKCLIEKGKTVSVQEATDRVGISRSSFYKYKDDISKFHDSSAGTTINLIFDMDDEPGALSDVLQVIADYDANILTIHQSIPINGVASLSISIQVLETTRDISEMLRCMEAQDAVHHVKVAAKE